MTLVEVLIAATLLGIVALGFGMMMQNQSRQQASVAMKSNMEQLRISIQSALASDSLIKKSLSNPGNLRP
jgi:type II secretory pathway pseudopilin PulG